VEFVVANSGGTTEYLVTQSLVNNSGQTWTDFHFELGFGVGTDFIRSGDTDGLDFDTPDQDPAPTSSVFAVRALHGLAPPRSTPLKVAPDHP